MPITISGSTGLTGVVSINAASANTPVILQDSGTNTNTCRAWVNFNGTGTVAIRASFNVSSITDNGTGDYTVNFINALSDANYGFACTCDTWNLGTIDSPAFGPYPSVAPTTTTLRLFLRRVATNAATDGVYLSVTIFR
jgi:hypothetical protein